MEDNNHDEYLIERYPQIMTRTMLCPECEIHQRPTINQVVLLHGETSNAPRLVYINQDAPVVVEKRGWGFTPHMILSPFEANTLFPWEEEIIGFKKVCCVTGCGVSFDYDEEDGYIYDILKAEYGYMPRNHFEALINFKDPSYHVNHVPE